MFKGEILVGKRYRLNVLGYQALPIKQVVYVGRSVRSRVSREPTVSFVSVMEDGSLAKSPHHWDMRKFRMKCIEEVGSDVCSVRTHKPKANARKSNRFDEDSVPGDSSTEVRWNPSSGSQWPGFESDFEADPE